MKVLRVHALKTYDGVELEVHAFLTSELDISELPASKKGLFTLAENAVGTHCIANRMCPRADRENFTDVIDFLPYWGLNHDYSIVSSVGKSLY
jgi:hypothetical protein